MTNDMTQDILYTIKNPRVTFRQRLKDMAKIAENSVELVRYTEKSREYFENGAMMDMFEGKTPYRTRYCVPDYELFLRQGSKFLMLEPPKDIWDAVGNLLCLYHNIPADGGLPVYIGCLDELLEPFVREEAEAEKINGAKREGGRVICVGTTSCRALESAAGEDGILKAGSGWTDIFIYPGYRFKILDCLVTNFHLPESTLVMLVSALAGRERVLHAYREAVREQYRFFSFGDAMLII